jgi:putative transposase
MSRSTYYYKSKAKKNTKNLVSKIEEIIIEYPRYGYRRVTHALRKNGTIVNHKVVLKLMKEHQLLCKKKSVRVAYTTDSNHDHPVYPNLIKDIVISGLNQVWVSDLTYIRIYWS